jgi:hypothetical protein
MAGRDSRQLYVEITGDDRQHDCVPVAGQVLTSYLSASRRFALV